MVRGIEITVIMIENGGFTENTTDTTGFMKGVNTMARTRGENLSVLGIPVRDLHHLKCQRRPEETWPMCFVTNLAQ